LKIGLQIYKLIRIIDKNNKNKKAGIAGLFPVGLIA